MFTALPNAAQGLLITSVSGGVYFLTYRLNESFDSWAIYAQGINLIFLPAGVKHLAILLGGQWGALGCFLSLIVLAREFWPGIASEQIVLYSLISTASTWLGIVMSLRLLDISPDLRNLRFIHLPFMDMMTTAFHGFATNAFFIMVGMKSDNFVANALAMMFGDFVGSFLLLMLLQVVLTAWKKSRASPHV